MFRSVPRAIALSACIAFFGLVLAGGAFGASDAGGTAVLAATLLASARAASVRVTIDPTGVTIRNVCRTMRTDLFEADRFEAGPTPWWQGTPVLYRATLVMPRQPDDTGGWSDARRADSTETLMPPDTTDAQRPGPAEAGPGRGSADGVVGVSGEGWRW